MPDPAPPAGVRLRLPAGMRIADAGPSDVEVRDLDFGDLLPLGSRRGVDVQLEEALSQGGLDRLWAVDLEPDPDPSSRDAGGIPDLVPLSGSADDALFEVDVAADEDAVVLVAQDDVLHWVFPEIDADAPDDAAPTRAAPGEAGVRRFRLPTAAEPVEGDGTRGLFQTLGKKLKAIVFKFVVDRVAGWAIDRLVERFERKVMPQQGLVWLSKDQWEPTGSPADLDGARRVLLLVHGTFSSTLGSFGALREGPGANAFRRWGGDYDLVLGFDHRTLSVTPEDNAERLADLLAPLHGAAVDVICYSRGGLVVRWLAERVLPVRARKPGIERVFFVGPTNGGTELARNANWHALVDTFTNLALASSKVLALTGVGPGVLPVLSGVVKGVSVLVKAMATVGTEGRVPGLWAMNPDGEFLVERTNGGTLPPQPDRAPAYLAFTSDFEPKLLRAAPDADRHQLPPKWVRLLADGFVDGLFSAADGERVPNDLVVDQASAQRVHPEVRDRFRDRFGVVENLSGNEACYHLNYFVQDHLLGWLDMHLDPRESMMEQGPAALAPENGSGAIEPTASSWPYKLTAGTPRAAPPSASPPRNGGGDDDGVRDGDLPDVDSTVSADPETVSIQIEAEAPAKVEVDTPFDLVTRLGRALDRSTGPNVAFGELLGVDPSKPLRVELRAISGVRLLDDTTRLKVEVPKADDILELVFEVMPTAVGTAEVWIVIGQRPDVRKRLKLTIEVVAELTGDAGVATVSVSASTGAAPFSHQLEATVIRSDGAFHIDYQLVSWPLQLRYRSAQPHRVEGDLAGFVANLHADIDAKAKKRGKADAGLLREIRAEGTRLFRQLLPTDLQRLLWTHRDALFGLQILSDDPMIPWEMLNISDPDSPTAKERRFLGELGLTRAIWNQWGATRIPWRSAGFEVIVPEYPAGSKYVLKFAMKEGAHLRERYGATALADRSEDAVLERLGKGGDLDVLHFAGHGESKPGQLNLILDGQITPEGWRPTRLSATVVSAEADLRHGEGGPLVFLNACQSGQQHFELTEDLSWSRVFLQAGAGAVIAPVWVVGDGSAMTFSTRLYEALLDQGLPFAEALRVARQGAFDDGDPTWLAYRAYAHPEARLVRTEGS